MRLTVNVSASFTWHNSKQVLLGKSLSPLKVVISKYQMLPKSFSRVPLSEAKSIEAYSGMHRIPFKFII